MSSEVKSLQELSFGEIRKHFSRHTAAYQLTEDDTLKKNLCFLQRVYTQTLFSELEQNKELKEEHFDFLLNEYLKKLDLATLLSCSTKEKILEKVLPIAHSLHELSWTCGQFDKARFILKRLIPQSSNLIKINIKNVRGDLFSLICSSCPHLLELSIQHSTVTSKEIKELCLYPDGQVQAKCPLKLLDLSHALFASLEDVAFLLKHLPTLEKVVYDELPNVIASIYLLEIEKNIVSDTKFNLQFLDLTKFNDDLFENLYLTPSF